jgi:hypothetical protein
MDRAADNHYPTSTLAEIKARDVPSIAANDCVLSAQVKGLLCNLRDRQLVCKAAFWLQPLDIASGLSPAPPSAIYLGCTTKRALAAVVGLAPRSCRVGAASLAFSPGAG